MQIHLCKIERRGLADPQAAPCDLLIMDLAGFAAIQLKHVRRAALGEYELSAVQRAQDQPPDDIFAFAGGMQVAI